MTTLPDPSSFNEQKCSNVVKRIKPIQPYMSAAANIAFAIGYIKADTIRMGLML